MLPVGRALLFLSGRSLRSSRQSFLPPMPIKKCAFRFFTPSTSVLVSSILGSPCTWKSDIDNPSLPDPWTSFPPLNGVPQQIGPTCLKCHLIWIQWNDDVVAYIYHHDGDQKSCCGKRDVTRDVTDPILDRTAHVHVHSRHRQTGLHMDSGEWSQHQGAFRACFPKGWCQMWIFSPC